MALSLMFPDSMLDSDNRHLRQRLGGLSRLAQHGCWLSLTLVLAAASTSLIAGVDVYNSASNLQGYINSYGSYTRENLIYLVREGFDGQLTLADLYAETMTLEEAETRCQALISDLRGAPAAQRVTNIWVLFGVDGTEEGHVVCRGVRE